MKNLGDFGFFNVSAYLYVFIQHSGIKDSLSLMMMMMINIQTPPRMRTSKT